MTDIATPIGRKNVRKEVGGFERVAIPRVP